MQTPFRCLVPLANRLADVLLALIATYRDADANIGATLAKTLEKLIRRRNATALTLTGFQVVTQHYERGSMILTSNLSFGSWDSAFASLVLACSLAV